MSSVFRVLSLLGWLVPTAWAAPGDVDDDGVPDTTDVCITVPDPGQQDSNNDGFGDACADPTASIATSVTFRGTWVGANAVLETGVDVGPGTVIGRGARVGARTVLGADVTVGPQAVLLQDVAIGDGVALGHRTTVGQGAEVDNNAVLGARVSVGVGASIGAGATLGRSVQVDANAVIGADSHISPEVWIGEQAILGARVLVRRGAFIGEYATLADRARVGRDAVIGPAATVGVGGVVRGDATVYEDLPANGYLPRGAVLGTPRKRIVLRDGARFWSDGTFASSCLAYVQASNPGETYAGDTGDGVYRLETTGAPFDAYCDMAGGGWTLALRVADNGNTFTFLSSHWTSSTTLNAAAPDPLVNQDAKYRAFNEVVGTQIRGCLRNASTGAYGCKTYALPSARTLLTMFATTPVGSRENNRGYYFSETRAERLQWQTMWGRPAGESTISVNYVDTGINMDDDLSNYRARVRFGLGLNNEANINTLNDTVGFGASAYYDTSAGGLAESPWRVSAGAAIGGTLIRTRGQIWVR